jgi:catechol 2,3-dioxygenase-like lactoylglutathione lyase family enzyme
MAATVDELRVADAPQAWAALGFAVEDDSCLLGEVRVHCAGEGDAAPSGLLGWALRGIGSTHLDGLPTELSERSLPAPAPAHPNGVTGIDHVVAITPRLERTVAALEAAGLDLRRIREEPTPAGAPRQAFLRLGPTILEVVQEPEDVAARNGADRPAFFWGLALLAPDIDATVAGLGSERCSEVRDAVQPGRRIASLRRGAGLGLPVALITPRPPRDGAAAGG